jgi:secondary thiamine-phosphate synthase enzyme
MKQFSSSLTIRTRGKGLYDFTREVAAWLRECQIQNGLLTLFIQHTSASLTIQENADPDVIRDLNDYFGRLVPENDPLYRHTFEGPDDMPAHIRSALTLTQLSVPVTGGKMTLGTWQGIYVFEHREHRHNRTVTLHLIGE